MGGGKGLTGQAVTAALACALVLALGGCMAHHGARLTISGIVDCVRREPDS